MPEIVYEDNHLLVAVKPPAQLTQSDNTGDLALLDELKEYLRVKNNKPGEAYLGLVHRLDRPVGGLVAFAKTSKAAARLSEQLRAHSMGREYLAVAEGGDMPPEGTFRDGLKPRYGTGGTLVVPEGTEGSQTAVLHYTKLAAHGDTVLLRIRLETGRKHQIRAQLSHHGHPLKYDMRYGHGEVGKTVALWGSFLTLSHPTKKQAMTFVSPPKGPAFEPYRAEIDALFAQYYEKPERKETP